MQTNNIMVIGKKLISDSTKYDCIKWSLIINLVLGRIIYINYSTFYRIRNIKIINLVHSCELILSIAG